MKRREVIFVVTSLILGAVIGGLIGEAIGTYLPPSAAKTLFTMSKEIGVNTFRIDFYAIALTFGLMIKINFMSVLFVLLVVVYFKWWYF
ncbi:MAG: DUF4321 domain-containing protein [candidate division Zixibacteria bacterium]|nr:DUF4321 domain-containing protein [candidate division Zixibacteria bacterium]